MDSYLSMHRESLLKRVGNISQIAGAKRYFLADGRGQGIECVDVRTGSGFEYTVMPGRGMDIGWCGYKGMPISYISKVGASAPSYFSGVQDQWRQCFPGGMLSTCGLSNVGSFCTDFNEGIGPQAFGQHGRISNQCAKNVCVCEKWQDEHFEIQVSGSVTEAQLRAENFTLERSVTSKLGENCLRISDVITNEDFIDRPCLFLYHVNFGFPVLDEGAVILTSPMQEYIDNGYGEADKMAARTISAPINRMTERLFFYKAAGDSSNACAGIYNETRRLFAYIRYGTKFLPYLTEWKMMGEGDYVVGLEAGNCIPRGRVNLRDMDALPILKARTSILNQMEIGIIEGEDKIQAFIKQENLNV